MARLVLLLGCLLLSGWWAKGASVTLAWDPSPDPAVAGYYLHYGTQSLVYPNRVNAGGTNHVTIAGLAEGTTYFFVLTAYDSQGVQSVPSAEISYLVPRPVVPKADPVRLRRPPVANGRWQLEFKVPPTTQYQILASEDLKTWTPIHQDVSLSTNWLEFVDRDSAHLPKRFYRLALPDVPNTPGKISLKRGGFPPGSKRLVASVSAGDRYLFEASNDLVNWTVLHDGVCSSTGPMDLIDTEAGLYALRFYRVRLLGGGGQTALAPVTVHDIEKGTCLQVAALPGQRYSIEGSSDMTTWTTIHRVESISAKPVELVDPNSAIHDRRFYRLVFD